MKIESMKLADQGETTKVDHSIAGKLGSSSCEIGSEIRTWIY